MTELTYKTVDILKQKEQYSLTIFPQKNIDWLESQLFEKRGNPYLNSPLMQL